MRFWAIYADYRPKNDHRIPYKIKTIDTATKKQIKSWWENIYSWLKIYDILEITEEEYNKGHNQLK